MSAASSLFAKRPRTEVDDDDDDDSTARLQSKQARRCSGELHEQPLQKAGYLIIHSVSCDGPSYHSHHNEQAYYLDAPHLFANDSKAEGLRGATPVPDLERFLEDNTDYDFVVEKEYDCEVYCKNYETQFHSIGNSRLRSKISESERAYLFTLSEDLPLATPSSESVTHFTPDMAEALDSLDDLCHWNRMFEPTDYLEEQRLEAPYINIYHSRKLLDDYKNKGVDPLYWPQIDTFREYVLGAMSTDYAEADALFEKSEITSAHFAKLFRKGDIVVTHADNERMGLLCESINSLSAREQRLACQSWEFDGLFQKKLETLQVAWPSDRSADDKTPIPITSLSVFPIQFGDQELRTSLKERGLMLWNCRFRKFVSYEAPTQTSGLQKTNLRYMVDMSTYHTLHQKEPTAPQDATIMTRDDIGDSKMKSEETPEDDFLLTLPAKVPAFGFHNKRWVDLSIKFMKDVLWDETAFQKLVMDEQKKELLEALVKVQKDQGLNQVSDVIEGKGNGLILLLHGSPGTGKTLTAEGVAELAHKPLYRVTCGDIGTQPEHVERYLDSVLYIGRTWDCVVLLDEADIFLEERSAMDLKRNALVSIFLRVLEYYDGILVLTTNRVGTFDEAFKSRIQLSLHYPTLGKLDRLGIWKMFLDAIKGEIKVTEAQVSVLAEHRLNGRQIRNTIKTASQQAFYQGRPLGFGHLQTAMKVANDFEDYICAARGQTDAERAADALARAPELDR